MIKEKLSFVIKAQQCEETPSLEYECSCGEHFDIDVTSLQKFAFHDLSEFDVDILLITIAVEYADRRVKRHQATKWSRAIHLEIPVSDPSLWASEQIKLALSRTLMKLTGDEWAFSFNKRSFSLLGEQLFIPIEHNGPYAIIPYSDGMDSMLLGMSLPKDLPQLRLTAWSKSLSADSKYVCEDGVCRIPMPVRTIFDQDDHTEPSYRTRPFKFFMFCALAAKWTSSKNVYLPENGQGVLSPVLTPKGVEFPYYGSHPIFTYELAEFVRKALGITIHFHHPNIWRTKGALLKEVVEYGVKLPRSMSCALDSRQGFGKACHCGVCTNCLLRRMSLHAAGLSEESDDYYYSDLDGRSLEEMSEGKGPHRELKSHLDIAFQAVQSVERFSNLAEAEDIYEIRKHAYELSEIGFCSEEEAFSSIRGLLTAHRGEWESFLSELSPDSWIRTKLREIR